MNRHDLVIPWVEVKDYLDSNQIVGERRDINKYYNLIHDGYLEHPLTVNMMAYLLELSRLTVEQRFLKNDLKHYDVKFNLKTKDGEKYSSPRDRIYIKTDDLFDFFISSCTLNYEKNEVDIVPFEYNVPFSDLASRKFPKCTFAIRIKRKVIQISNESSPNQEQLKKSLLGHGWTSLKQLQQETGRSRSSMILLGNMLDSITFIPPFSKSRVRRYLFYKNISNKSHIERILSTSYKLPLLTEEMMRR